MQANISNGRSSMKRSLAMFVLLLEAFVIFFATLLASSLEQNFASFVLLGGFGLFLMFFMAIAVLRKTGRYVFGFVLQLLMFLTGFVVFSMFFIGLLFIACWFYALFLGNKIDFEVEAVEKAANSVA